MTDDTRKPLSIEDVLTDEDRARIDAERDEDDDLEDDTLEDDEDEPA